jgi:hypothetical protein
MELATARTILEHPETAPARADFVAAGLVLADHWRRNPNLLKPMRGGGVMTTDSPRRETLAAACLMNSRKHPSLRARAAI